MPTQIWNSLRRVTSSGRYIPEIDGLRFVAIASVIVYHMGVLSEFNCGICIPFSILTPELAAVFNMGRGVLIFFSISGMVLGLPFAERYIANGRKVILTNYFLRRVTRLEPPYLINLLLRFPLVMATKHLTIGVMLAHMLASVFYLHGFIFGKFPLIHPPSWSLEIEVQFYLLAPLLAFLFFPRSAWVRRVSLLAMIIAFSTLHAHMPQSNQTRFNISLLNYLQFFLIGILMADGYITLLPKLKASWWWDMAGIPLWCAVFFLPDSISDYLMPVMLLGAFTSAFKGRLLNLFFRNPFVATVGGMCYSIYLTHSLVLQACYAGFAKFHFLDGFYRSFAAGILLAFPATLLTGTVFYVLIERPCMDKAWPHKLGLYLRNRFGPA